MPNDTQPTSSSGSNKWLYIVIGAVVILALLGFFARSAGWMAMRASGVNVTPGPGGSATYTAPDGTGSVTVGSNKMPDNWPADAPQNFAGATIMYSGSSNPQTGKAGAAVVYTAQTSASAVLDYYKTQLATSGWKVEQTATMGATSVLSASKDNRTFGVSITDAGNGTVQVTAGLDI